MYSSRMDALEKPSKEEPPSNIMKPILNDKVLGEEEFLDNPKTLSTFLDC